MSQGFDDKHRGSVFNRLGKRRSTIPSTHDDSFSHRTPYPNNEQHYTRSFHSEHYTDETSGHYHHSSHNDSFGDQENSSYHPGNLIITAPARGGDRFVFNGSSSEQQQQLLTAPYYAAAEEQQPVVWTESQYPSQSITPIQLNPSYTSEVPLPTSTRFFNAPSSPASSTTPNGRRDTYIPDYSRLRQSKKPRKNELPPEPKKRRTVTPTPSTPPPSLSPKAGVTKPVTQEERCSSGESVISMDLDSDNLMLPDWGEDNDNEAKLQAIARENRRQHEIEQEQSRLRQEEERRLAEKKRLLEEEKTRKQSQSEEKLKEEETRQARWERFCRQEEERDAQKRREEEEQRRQEEEEERKKQEERKQREAEERRRKQQEAFERVKKEQAERARLEEQKRQAEEAARLKRQAEEAARLKRQAEETARLKRQAEEALRLKREQEAAERKRRELERQEERKRREKEQQEEDQRRQESERRRREREERHRMEKEQREQEEFERRQREDEERRKQLEDERLRQEEQVRQLLLQQQQEEERQKILEEEQQKELEEERMQQEQQQQQQQAQQEAVAAEMAVKQELTADAPQEYDDNGPLPTGWQVHYSRSTNKSYFYNVTTGESTWERPRMESTQDTQPLQPGEVAPETTPDPTIAQQQSTPAVQLEAKPLTHDAIAEIPPQLENVDTAAAAAAAAAFVPETNAVLSPTLEEEFADMVPQAVYSMPPSNESRDPRIQAMKKIEQDKKEMDAQPVKPASHYFVQHRPVPRAPRPSEPTKAANSYRFPPLEYRPKTGPPFRVGRKDSYVPNYRPSTSAVSRRRDQ